MISQPCSGTRNGLPWQDLPPLHNFLSPVPCAWCKVISGNVWINQYVVFPWTRPSSKLILKGINSIAIFKLDFHNGRILKTFFFFPKWVLETFSACVLHALGKNLGQFFRKYPIIQKVWGYSPFLQWWGEKTLLTACNSAWQTGDEINSYRFKSHCRDHSKTLH